VPILLLLLAFLLPAPSAAAGGLAGWRWPVGGPVLAPYAVGASPYAAGQHRGIDIGAPRGSPVRAACTGRVRFAGVAARNGRTVSLLCGRYVTTYTQLASTAVRRGDAIAAGHRLGAAGAAGSETPHVHFGVRVAARRFGYVDPLSVLPSHGGPAGAPLGPAPRGATPSRRRVPRPPPPPDLAPAQPLAARGRAPAPLLPWAALGLAAAALPGRLAVSARRRRRSSRREVSGGRTASSRG
jgi:hypothetical protein